MSEAAVYDAFISYSHTADARLAPLLEAGLRAMGKPWYRRRARRVFRDQASLPAAPELWPSIERALAALAGVRPRCPRPAPANDRSPLPRPHRPMTTAPAR
ncbi:hypothetical protein [Nonomuraea roseoviolacea]|uniref:TIR domain-containing protein n=1 Tax=Nonomuraea roseoviolacea subsp. carminata TaxID=160689 RepID=A0ABT1K9N6_9ACTN|nr:hypothetical protein [Nonomuraea roseoviolacea]MCP2350733.1 hypothetical protein [Nonomuraea roseoviolacea subsp. carminata]